jgi:tRNA dimethylallyltransferase
LGGEIPLAVARAEAQQATRNYAKRQLTWFRHQMVADLVFDRARGAAPALAEAVERFLLTADGRGPSVRGP